MFMSPDDIDSFGILEAPEQAKDPGSYSDPALLKDTEATIPSTRKEVPNSPLWTELEYPASEDDIPEQRDIAVSGDENVTAGRDIDQSQGKTEIHGDIYFNAEAPEN